MPAQTTRYLYSTMIRPKPRMMIASIVLILAGTASACASGSTDYQPVPPQVLSSSASSDQSTEATGGHVWQSDGTPYAGATVLFRNVYGGELHTITGTDGGYSVTLPPGTYNAKALVDQIVDYDFALVDPSLNPVTVPTSKRIDFVVVPLSS